MEENNFNKRKYYVWYHFDCYSGSSVDIGLIDENTPPEDSEGNSNVCNDVVYFNNISDIYPFLEDFFEENFEETIKDKIYFLNKNLEEKDVRFLKNVFGEKVFKK